MVSFDKRARAAAYVGGLLGLALLVVLVIRADFGAIVQTMALAGWGLFWLTPYRTLYFLLYALGWRRLLEPCDPQRHAGLGYLFWVTSVREAIDRLLPVASLGGSVAGVRLLRWRGLAAAPVTASVMVEILLTLAVLYVFTALGLLLLFGRDPGQAHGQQYHRWLIGFVLSLPAPVTLAVLLRYASVFSRLQGFLRQLVGENLLAEGAAALDHELRVMLSRWGTLCGVGALQFAAVLSGSLEIWFVLRLCGHPVGIGVAVILESLTQAMRHLAFLVPAGLGVQEATLVLMGRLFGIDAELALAVSMAKRLRELLCGLPPLVTWQWMEARRLRILSGPSA
jgi:putative membrane protein